MPFACERLDTGGDAVVRVRGEVDIATAGELSHAIEDAARRAPGSIAVDLRAVSFIDCAGLHAILSAAHALGPRLVVYRGGRAAERLFTQTRVEQRLRFSEPADVPADGESHADYVRRVCDAYIADGIDGIAAITPLEVEWSPWHAGGRVLRGAGELRAFWAGKSQPRGALGTPRVCEQRGDDVIVRLPMRLPDGVVKVLWSRFEFEAGALARASSFESERAALAGALS